MKKLVLVLLGLVIVAHADETNKSEATCRAHLKRLGGATRAYRLIHEGKSPEKLSDLYYEGLVEDLATFVCPATGHDVPARTEIDAKTDYTLEPLPNTKDLVVREKSPGHANDKVLGVFADGTIKLLAAPGLALSHAANIGFVAVIATVVLGGLGAAALWAYLWWVGPRTNRRQPFILEVTGEAARTMQKFRAQIESPRQFLKTARHRWDQIAGRLTAARRESASHVQNRPVEPPRMPTEKAKKIQGINCPWCKTLNFAPAKFCCSCGRALVADQAAVVAPSATCKACGKTLKPDAKFCVACGFRVIT